MTPKYSKGICHAGGKFMPSGDALSDAEVGSWVVATYKVIKGYDLNEPTFDHYEATILAAKAGLMLSPIRRLNRVTEDDYNIFRTMAGLKPRESVIVLTHLVKLEAAIVEWDQDDGGEGGVQAITSAVTSKLGVLEAVGQLFMELNPSPTERASVMALRATVGMPMTEHALQSLLVAADINEPIAKRAIDHLVILGLLSRTIETESGSPLLFNPLIFKGNAQDAYAAIKGLSGTQHQQALEILEFVRGNPGVPFPPNLSDDIVTLLVKCGLIDVSAVVVQAGMVRKEFPTAPSMWATAKSLEELGGDMVDDAKVLLNSLRYGELFSSSGRGQINDPEVLVDRLIRRGSVGPCTAIGQDYPLPLARGIVSVVESRIKPGQFHMELRKGDVAEAVLDVFKHKVIVPDLVKDETVVQQLKQRGQYIPPESVRVQKMLPREFSDQQDSLAFELRTFRKGR